MVSSKIEDGGQKDIVEGLTLYTIIMTQLLYGFAWPAFEKESNSETLRLIEA